MFPIVKWYGQGMETGSRGKGESYIGYLELHNLSGVHPKTRFLIAWNHMLLIAHSPMQHFDTGQPLFAANWSMSNCT